MKQLMIIVACVALVSFVNCSKTKLTFQLHDEGTIEGNYTAYAKLVDQGGDETDTAKYSGLCSYVRGEGSMVIDDVAKGNYTWYVFIDKESPYSENPSSKDRTAGGEAVKIDKDMTIIVNDGWGDYK